MKKVALLLLCLTLALALASCAKVTGDNSFQNGTPGDTTPVSQDGAQTQPEQNTATDAQPAATDAPNTDPNAAGYNG